MKTTITLEKMRFHAFHGVMEQERLVGNEFEVSLAVKYDFERAMSSDNLADTLNYAALYDVVKSEMDVPSKLLEHVAGRIINSVKGTFPEIEGGVIEVKKLTPPFKCELAAVAIKVKF